MHFYYQILDWQLKISFKFLVCTYFCCHYHLPFKTFSYLAEFIIEYKDENIHKVRINITRITTLIKTKFKKSDDHTNIDNIE